LCSCVTIPFSERNRIRKEKKERKKEKKKRKKGIEENKVF